ncbi:uncharacterized protein LOC119371922 [Rhipicephalus sanguineus]|uniref:uncharacterized protein LOC119371922 n=1 Tax=Rhipicephalus sanguineus TaxID=34632 RepID=UPI001892D526|nr:uncharacterized protein LOC119371922 [Rhipicephalus sanguineus]
MEPGKNGAETLTKRRRTVRCCVHGCYNSLRNTAGKVPKIHFYAFPWRLYEKERRERWIRAVRQANPQGGLWKPVQSKTRICSAHFVGNEISTVAKDPAYIPTIFPACNAKSDRVTPSRKLERFRRVKRRGSAAVGGPPINTVTSGKVLPQEELRFNIAEWRIACASVVTQTEEDQGSGCCTVFLSALSGGSACTQVCHSDNVDASVQAVPTTYDDKHRSKRAQLHVSRSQHSH